MDRLSSLVPIGDDPKLSEKQPYVNYNYKMMKNKEDETYLRNITDSQILGRTHKFSILEVLLTPKKSGSKSTPGEARLLNSHLTAIARGVERHVCLN